MSNSTGKGAPFGAVARKQRMTRAKAERLQRIADQVAAGTLRIRQATAEDRERYGIRAPVEREDDDATA